MSLGVKFLKRTIIGRSFMVVVIVVVTLVVVFLQYKSTNGLSDSRDVSELQKTNVSLLSAHFAIPGFGNLMFQFASMYGMARTTNRVPVIANKFVLLKYFDLQVNQSQLARPGLSWGKLVEQHSNKYDEVIPQTAMVSRVNLELVGYFQSWEYFRHWQAELRSQFKFKSHITKEVLEIKKRSGFLEVTSTEPKNSFVVVGIHVRRTDMLFPQLQEFGYTVADKDYIERAMHYFEEKHSDVRYVVTTDDIVWCRQNIDNESRKVWFSSHPNAMVDLALLASSDHVIMTVGTFGWWAGWLSNGRVIYYKDFPRHGSKLEKAFSESKHDYFLPNWIGL